MDMVNLKHWSAIRREISTIKSAVISLSTKGNKIEMNTEHTSGARDAIVVTSIFEPSKAIRDLEMLSIKSRCRFVVAGDKKTPSTYENINCDYLSVQRQIDLYPNLAKALPFNHYVRKNVGYIHAIRNGAQRIIETDDDNFPKNKFLDRIEDHVSAELISGDQWINVYDLYADGEQIWPRGYPLERIQEPSTLIRAPKTRVYAPIQQGLADANPDVDAIYRMVGKLPFNFIERDDVALAAGCWCPFNSQVTTWFKEAFPLLYLPSTCTFRMTDIWRSFVAQRILWENGATLLFHNATAHQERNDHSLHKDFLDEVPGYINNQRIIDALSALDLSEGWENSGSNLIKCYRALIGIGVIHLDEMQLVEQWVREIENV